MLCSTTQTPATFDHGPLSELKSFDDLLHVLTPPQRSRITPPSSKTACSAAANIFDSTSSLISPMSRTIPSIAAPFTSSPLAFSFDCDHALFGTQTSDSLFDLIPGSSGVEPSSVKFFCSSMSDRGRGSGRSRATHGSVPAQWDPTGVAGPSTSSRPSRGVVDRRMPRGGLGLGPNTYSAISNVSSHDVEMVPALNQTYDPSSFPATSHFVTGPSSSPPTTSYGSSYAVSHDRSHASGWGTSQSAQESPFGSRHPQPSVPSSPSSTYLESSYTQYSPEYAQPQQHHVYSAPRSVIQPSHAPYYQTEPGASYTSSSTHPYQQHLHQGQFASPSVVSSPLIDDERRSKRIRTGTAPEPATSRSGSGAYPPPPLQVTIPAATEESAAEAARRAKTKARGGGAAAPPRKPSGKPQKSMHPHETVASVPPQGTSGSSAFYQFQASVVKSKSPSSDSRSHHEDEMMVDAQTMVATGHPEPPFEHGPSELPPRPYPGGPDAESPWKPQKKPGKIPGSAMDYLPVLEARFDRLENAIDKYVDYRAERAIANSKLPGESFDSSSLFPFVRPSSSYYSRRRSPPS